MEIDDIYDFFKNNIQSRHYTYLVISKKEEMDMEALNSLGTLKELKLGEIFGY